MAELEKFSGSGDYVVSEELMRAVNIAIADEISARSILVAFIITASFK